MITLALILLVLAAIPAVLQAVNLFCYRPLPRCRPSTGVTTGRRGSLSVLIPARNEQDAIGPALASVLADPRLGDQLEVLVLDDHSTDGTAEAVRAFAQRDPRVRLIPGAPLPKGWCGKQHACWQLAAAANHPILVFLDADVRLAPDSLRRLQAYLESHPHVDLASGVPRQRTGTLAEHLLIPLIHTVLLGYLPLPAARAFPWSAFAAGCGQWFVARRSAYFATGGHRAIRGSLHDGVQLPRAFRRQGFVTDLFDATDSASCRMYQGADQVWRGLGKNATEGLAQPAAILPWTVLLLGGHVMPWLLLALPLSLPPAVALCALLGGSLTLGSRLVAAWVFRQNLLGALLHPIGITLLVGIQWRALLRSWQGRPQEWRGRHYARTDSKRSVPPSIVVP